MGTIDSLLNPAALRSRLSGKTHEGADDEGAMLVEAMVYIAIFAILAGAIGPQMTKFIEKAAVNNLIGEVQSAVQTIEGDYSLEGKLKYNKANVATSATTVRKATTTTFATGLLTPVGANSATLADDAGYWVKGTSTETPSYSVCYVAVPASGATKQLTVKTTMTCP